jgi:hypothetical protein
MSKTKDKYFEILVREENMIKYHIRANDQQQAERIFQDHSKYYGDQHSKIVASDKHIIEIGESHDPF